MLPILLLLGAQTCPPPVATELERLTRPFLGAPYLRSPLGEGDPTGLDPDPRFRLDAFDCTTFVETALASLTARPGEVAAELDRVRYDGAPSYRSRRHLMEVSWLPGLIADGRLEDITAEVGGPLTQRDSFAVTAQRWSRRTVARSLALPAESLPAGEVVVRWIRFGDVAKVHIPAGSVINVVREDVPHSPTRVSHQGLVFFDERTGRTMVRHASSRAKMVVDETLARFVGVQRHLGKDTWRTVGLSVFRVTRPGVADACQRSGVNRLDQR